MIAIKRIDENKNEVIFKNLTEASKSIRTRLDEWKVQLFIADAINNKKRAFKYRWEEVTD